MKRYEAKTAPTYQIGKTWSVSLKNDGKVVIQWLPDAARALMAPEKARDWFYAESNTGPLSPDYIARTIRSTALALLGKGLVANIDYSYRDPAAIASAVKADAELVPGPECDNIAKEIYDILSAKNA